MASVASGQVFTGQEHDEKTGLIYFGARFYDPDVARFINQDSYLGESTTPPSLHRYLYAYSNPLVYIDPDGNAAYLASGQEFDDYGAQLYAQGNKLGAAGVAVAGAFYKVGTGFFSLGLFDEANDAITTTDTYGAATKQFGSSVANTAKEVAKEYAEEGAASAALAVGGKVACGRWKQACDKAIESGKKVYEKLNTDIGKAKNKSGSSLTQEQPDLESGNGQSNTDVGKAKNKSGSSLTQEKPNLESGNGQSNTDVTKSGDQRVFHRLGDSKENIEAIQKSGELRGNPPRNTFASDIPKVQAYEGPLPKNAQGFEFTTSAKPDRRHVPSKPTWSGNGHNPDVKTENDQAVISCTVTNVNC